MRKRVLQAAAILLCLMLSPLGGLETDDSVVPLIPRSAGMGGPHAALTDGVLSIFNNPAGFKLDESELQISETTIGLSGPIFDMTGLIIQGVGGGDLTTLLLEPDVQDLLRGVYAGMTMKGPVSLIYVGGGVGFGVFNWLDFVFRSVGTLTLNVGLRDSLLITGGYAFRFPLPTAWNSTLDMGIQLKSHIRGEVNTTTDIFGLISLFEDLGSFVTGEPFELGVGIGLDVGATFNYNQLLAFGITARDLYSPVRRNRYESIEGFRESEGAEIKGGLIPLDLSAGLMFSPPMVRASRIISDLTLLLDYSDILDFATHPNTAKMWILHFGFGLEATFLEILSLRAGMYDGMFSSGIGLDLSIFRLDAAMYGTELSSVPGLRPIYNIVFGLSFDL